MATQSKHRRKRRQYLVNPQFQLRFMIYIALAVLLGFTIIYTSNLWYFSTLVSQGQELGLDPSHPYYELIEDQRKLLTRTYLIISGITFVLLMWAGLFLSHRIAGPLYRIESYMKQVTAGDVDLKPVHLRKGDFFPEIADILNDVIAHLRDEAKASTGQNVEEKKEVEKEVKKEDHPKSEP